MIVAYVENLWNMSQKPRKVAVTSVANRPVQTSIAPMDIISVTFATRVKL